MSQPTRIDRRHVILIVAAAALLVIGFAAGLLAARTTASLPDECAKALNASDAIVIAVDKEWDTASAAVDGVQSAVRDSGYRRLVAACRST
ncbi:MAG: hypothetical protein GEU86_08945 [Actinophytocola sp.]|nr:hypothetical protein [Actinophytocola sp.]